MKLRAVLFDMDGVLVRSEEVWFRLVAESGVRFRGRAVTREEFSPTFGQGTRADVEVFGLACAPDELDRFYRDHFHEHSDATWVDPDAAEVLRAIRAAGLGIAVVTNTATELARRILDSASLLPLVDVVACSDQVARPKPAPDVVRHAMAQLGVLSTESVMVGDSRYDREAANAAGVRFLGYRIDGDARVESLPALRALVGE
jgi:HAD superfamily hydrolase (TIGR01509 family)